MTRAEQRALEAYPVNMTPLVYQDLIDQFGGKTEIDVNTYPRCLFQQGYEQAEKDLTRPESSEDLEEAAGLYLDNHKPLTRYNWGDLQDAFKAGAEWQREQDATRRK